jgi:hypothetical protein
MKNNFLYFPIKNEYETFFYKNKNDGLTIEQDNYCDFNKQIVVLSRKQSEKLYLTLKNCLGELDNG